MSKKLVNCREVSRIYEGAVPVVALNAVNFSVEAGEWVSLVGPSGSGKSTLLHLLGGLDRPDRGTIELEGVALNGLSDTELVDLRLYRIGFVFQAYNLIPVLSALENVEFIMQLQGLAAGVRRERARACLDSLGLGELGARRPGELSGGQQQRVAIARAIVTTPALLLADEPSANLDSAATHELLELMQRLNREQQVTIVTATHDPMVMAYATRRVVLRDGELDAGAGGIH